MKLKAKKEIKETIDMFLRDVKVEESGDFPVYGMDYYHRLKAKSIQMRSVIEYMINNYCLKDKVINIGEVVNHFDFLKKEIKETGTAEESDMILFYESHFPAREYFADYVLLVLGVDLKDPEVSYTWYGDDETSIERHVKTMCGQIIMDTLIDYNVFHEDSSLIYIALCGIQYDVIEEFYLFDFVNRKKEWAEVIGFLRTHKNVTFFDLVNEFKFLSSDDDYFNARRYFRGLILSALEIDVLDEENKALDLMRVLYETTDVICMNM